MSLALGLLLLFFVSPHAVEGDGRARFEALQAMLAGNGIPDTKYPLIGSLPAASGQKMHFTGTTVLRIENGKIAEEIGLDDGVTALQQLSILNAA